MKYIDQALPWSTFLADHHRQFRLEIELFGGPGPQQRRAIGDQRFMVALENHRVLADLAARLVRMLGIVDADADHLARLRYHRFQLHAGERVTGSGAGDEFPGPGQRGGIAQQRGQIGDAVEPAAQFNHVVVDDRTETRLACVAIRNQIHTFVLGCAGGRHTPDLQQL